MDGCEVKGCLQFNTKAVTALSFPEDPALRSQWIQFCGRQKSWTPEKFAKICSVHFKDRDFTLEHNESVPTKKLKDGSIPSINSLKTNDDPLDPNSIVAVDLIVKEIQDVCRICLVEHPETQISLLSVFEDEKVGRMMTYCTSLEVDDSDFLPKSICELCFRKLKAAKELKQISIASDNYLRKIYENSKCLKQEEFIQTSDFLQIKLEPIEILNIEPFQVKDEDMISETLQAKEIRKCTRQTKASKISAKKKNLDKHCQKGRLLKLATSKRFSKRACAICSLECLNSLQLNKHWLEAHDKDRKCHVCSIEMISAKSLHYHMVKHNQGSPFPCRKCDKNFASQRSLEAHKLTHSSTYFCDFCTKSYTSKYSLIGHIEISHLKTNQQYSCDECDKKFNRKNGFDMHLISKHGGTAPVTCSKCKMGFLFISQLNTHDREIHQYMKPKRTHYNHTKTCQICMAEYETSSKLAQHIKYQHANDRKCERCQMTLGSSKELNRHLLMHDRKQIHICHVCGKSMKSADALIAHQGIHKIADFSCDVCGVKVKQKKSLCKHIESVHLKLGHVDCPDCQSRFKSADAMRYHRISKHDVPAPITCNQCNKGFLYISQLNVHEFEHHLKVKIQRNYTNNHNKCDICNRVFWRSSHLQKHQELHKQGYDWVKNKADGVKPLKHKCNYCEKAFHNRWLLDNHHRSHTGEKPFRCEICGSRYNLTKTLRNHQKTVHKMIKPVISMKTHYFPEDPSEIGKPREPSRACGTRAEIA